MCGHNNLKKMLQIEGSFLLGHLKKESGSNKMGRREYVRS